MLLSGKTVSIAGIGAVGGFAVEMLARCGIGHIRILDFDTVSETNINRQIIALHSTIGMLKTDVMKKRILDINPDCHVEAFPEVLTDENHYKLFDGADIVLDCIDSVGAKISLLSDAYHSGIPIVSSMGAALRRNASLVRTADIMDTWGCPLARQIRSGLRKQGVGKGIESVFSPEKVDFNYIDPDVDEEAETAESGRKRRVLGSLPIVTAVFGELMADLALRKLLPNGTLDGRAEGNARK